ncbi:hypothetical protein F0L74_22875 [Chitinophaga agrisoli]|uniref:Cold-shock protein n=1 Tax=Chitinophaga agrisoli TaxID=2607653 RepID=A0A5B2VK60_9BACT|nr:hypothetical protein [Chitinophaga agrisoli]KAA2239058.1 hypothetical protein F0L74_22875 [Chitinophaga agrisoli]
MAMTWNKKERENKKRQAKKKKEEKMQERKNSAGKDTSLENMMAYLDEDGNLTSLPPDQRKKKADNPEAGDKDAAPEKE